MWEVPSFLNPQQPNSIDEKVRKVRVSSGRFGTVAFESDPDQLKSAREDIKELLRTKFFDFV
ncbi:stromal ascorbate peroxidase, putative [Medicago truncatula]|uniref:Stromal ascorbate peroxidase, putative n=1 Tax=Medicago truncatula TaxID=3880 RepID=G7K7V6_MEDTR|nr:stromal ascorbate peroxidase, putative [Medicago truncatula]